MKRYINFTGGSENVDFLKIFSNICVLFCSKLMSGQLNIDSNSCVNTTDISPQKVKIKHCINIFSYDAMKGNGIKPKNMQKPFF